MNFIVTKFIIDYMDSQGIPTNEFYSSGGYNRFVVVYHSVAIKLWFGNRADEFTLTNSETILVNSMSNELCNSSKSRLPDYSNWGLPCNLGLSRANNTSISSVNAELTPSTGLMDGQVVPRFYYGETGYGRDGFWLFPIPIDSSGSVTNVFWVEAPFKLNLMGEPYIYMEIDGQNCIDETQPYNVSKFTMTTNGTNGVVNSSFAKISVPTTPLSQWFDRDSQPYKYYYPPAERIRRLKITLRYHNGQMVDFGVFNYSFMLEFNLQVPQMLRNSNTVIFPKGKI